VAGEFAVEFAQERDAVGEAKLGAGGGERGVFRRGRAVDHEARAGKFTTNSTGGNAQLVTAAGGIVDFSGSSGPGGDSKLSAGSIAGAGSSAHLS
jgi:hypothetical protein